MEILENTLPLLKKGICPKVLCTPTVIGMVGLPARGKSFIAKRLTRYLHWIGVRTAVFNLGQYRRRVTTDLSDHNFFRADNQQALEIREKCAAVAIEEAVQFFKAGGKVAIIDATNTTRKRRQLLLQRFTVDHPFHLFFLESICDDPAIIEANILDVKVGGLDYMGQDKDHAVRDFLQRIDHYQQVYEPVGGEGEEEVPYIQIINQGAQFVINKPIGLLQERVLFYLMKVRVHPRTVFLIRHGESTADADGQLGGDSELTEQGRKFAENLSEYLAKEKVGDVKVWTSGTKRALQTAACVRAPQKIWPALNDMNAGLCEAMTSEELQAAYPEQLALQQQGPLLQYRYPGGESYQDMIARLEPVIMELEQTMDNVVIVSHDSVLRCLLAYLWGTATEEMPYMNIPNHTVIKVSPTSYGHAVEFFPLL